MTNHYIPEPLDLGPASVRWVTPAGREMKMLADSSVLDKELYTAEQFRFGHKYPRQKNVHGVYYFSQVSHHVWHESLLESSILTWLDHHTDVVAIAAQPVEIIFGDGSTHIPDFLTMRADNSQVLIDVKPTKYLGEKARLQFDKTLAVCTRIGWQYEVHTELPRQMQINLAWIGAFRHPSFHPGADAVARLLAAMTLPTMSLLDAARSLGLGALPRERAAIYHLIYSRDLTIDNSLPLSDATLIRKAA